MKQLISYIVRYHREEFKYNTALISLLFLGICIWANFKWDFEDGFIDSYTGKNIRILLFFLENFLAFFSGIFFLLITKSITVAHLTIRFWIFSFFAISVLSIDRGAHHFSSLFNYIPAEHRYLGAHLILNFKSLITIFLPLGVFYIISGEKSGFYGLFKRNIIWKPYVILLVCMIPLIILASFTKDFQNQYPFYNIGYEIRIHKGDLPLWKPILYELSYAYDFISVELFFRGFLIIGMIRILGPKAIIPMVIMYCFLHFGKPLGECISSIFGGYLLGILAYYGRNIWGGILVHVGTALLMDIASILQKFY